jgi:hypothetical protein
VLQAQRDAAAQLVSVEERFARLRLEGEDAIDGLEVSVDGARLKTGAENAAPGIVRELALDAGPHRLVAAAPGRRPSAFDVTLAEGETKSIPLALEPSRRDLPEGGPHSPCPQGGAVTP